MMRKLAVSLVLACALMLVDACWRDGAAPPVAPLVQGGCVLLRAVTSSGEVHEACAQIEDLAPVLGPLVDQIIAERADARATGARVAFALTLEEDPKPARKPPKRRCAKWEYLDAGAPADAGEVDGGR